MRLIDADELMEHIYRDRLDSRELIAQMVEKAPTEKAISLSVIKYIKAEIRDEKEFAYADFEQYKIDYLGVDAEYVYDELPQDDFRYGMERCLEIIDKHIADCGDNKRGNKHDN